MPPPGSSQKGTGKKGGAGAIRQQPRSRNTTPSSALPATANLPPIEVQETETLELKFDVFRDLTYEDLVDSGASSALIPDSKALDGIKARLERLAKIIDDRNNYCDRGMRLLAQSKRDRRMNEMAEEGRREDERIQREADEERERKANKKKRKATESLAPQSSNVGQFYSVSLHFHQVAHQAFSQASSPRALVTCVPTYLVLPVTAHKPKSSLGAQPGLA
jgi:transcriptional adapter 3